MPGACWLSLHHRDQGGCGRTLKRHRGRPRNRGGPTLHGVFMFYRAFLAEALWPWMLPSQLLPTQTSEQPHPLVPGKLVLEFRILPGSQGPFKVALLLNG